MALTDDSAPDRVVTLSAGHVCDFCQGPMPERKARAGRRVRFCRPKCRAAWHKAERKRAIQSAIDILTRALGGK